MTKIHLFMRALALLLSVVTGTFSGLVPHSPVRYYDAQKIGDYTAVSKAAYPDGMIIAIGGGFDTDETFRPILERCMSQVGKGSAHLLFLPTAAHDEYSPDDAILTRFAAAGCETDVLLVSRASAQEVAEKFAWADIVYATGGSLKFLTENWSAKGVYAAAKSGVPDLFLPVARGRYHGLFIEMKAQKGRLSENQANWLKDLRLQGYAAAVCYGAREAIDIITKYFAQEDINDG